MRLALATRFLGHGLRPDLGCGEDGGTTDRGWALQEACDEDSRV